METDDTLNRIKEILQEQAVHITALNTAVTNLQKSSKQAKDPFDSVVALVETLHEQIKLLEQIIQVQASKQNALMGLLETLHIRLSMLENKQ